jgi:hypothetical protein
MTKDIDITLGVDVDDLEKTVQIVRFKNPDFDREYTVKWLREFDRSMESDGFTRQLVDLLQETGLQ